MYTAVTVCVQVCMRVLTSRDGDWWYAENTDRARCGYIPNNFVAEVNSIRQFEYVYLYQTLKPTDSLHVSHPALCTYIHGLSVPFW